MKQQFRSELERYIIRAKEEVACWPEWKRKHTSLGFSEYQKKQEDLEEKNNKTQNK